ncbi:MAG: DUF4333 domain-containing protein [Cyanobacteriota bacterium]|nr:DUF4333 domain-containing protein [Cyanobacteriota bacterium]
MRPNLILGLALLTSLTLTACGSGLDARQVEGLIQADLERQGRRLSLKEVQCPTDLPRQAGATFRCVGQLDPEGSFTINVTQGDEPGQVTWDVPNSSTLINLAKVETSIQQGLGKALGKAAVIDCGSATYRINQPGDRFQCQIVGGLTDGPDQLEAVLVTIDPKGNLDWREIRPDRSATLVANPTPASAATTAPTPGPASTRAALEPTKPQGTEVTGPTGRPVTRPYIPGDND